MGERYQPGPGARGQGVDAGPCVRHHLFFFPVLAIKVLQALILRVSLCTLGTFLGPDNGLEFNLLRKSFRGY
jgi:hypothetical protein